MCYKNNYENEHVYLVFSVIDAEGECLNKIYLNYIIDWFQAFLYGLLVAVIPTGSELLSGFCKILNQKRVSGHKCNPFTKYSFLDWPSKACIREKTSVGDVWGYHALMSIHFLI